ncbi:MAG: glycosyltransferase family 2 protein, partial [Promethearchaeota archaeon]
SEVSARTRKNNREFLEWDTNYRNLDEILGKFSSRTQSKLLSIVIPVYNEEKTIKKVLEQLPKNVSIEIILVDDHSTDNSLDEIKKAKNVNRVKIINHAVNRGYGSAILTGIKNATGHIVITMDSDGQHRPEDIYYLVAPIFENLADVTVGSRYRGTYNYRLPIATRLGEAVIEKFMQFFFGQKVANNQGGFRAFHRKTLKIFNDIKFKDYAFTTELLFKASLLKFRILECPIHLVDREHGSSKIVLSKLILSLLLCVAYYTIQRINSPYYNKWMMKRFYFIKKLPMYREQKSIESVVPELNHIILFP